MCQQNTKGTKVEFSGFCRQNKLFLAYVLPISALQIAINLKTDQMHVSIPVSIIYDRRYSIIRDDSLEYKCHQG